MSSGWWSILVGIGGGIALIWLALIIALWVGKPNGLSLREAARLLPDVVRLLKRLATDAETPRGVRIGLALVLVYLALPIDIIPDFIPVIGFADDAIVVAIGLRFVTRAAGPEALAKHWPGTPDGLAAVRRLCRLPKPGKPETAG